ncbi:MAG: hypothetical protein NC200_01130 [Candidatus Gastranaerophilales bacterium]|nr:hypothetical protein [Candidatus Gastranaerophilales bacterium]
MGKSKRRSIARGKYNQISNMTRDEAVSAVVEKIAKHEDVSELVTLFGLKAEELLEGGADYEAVKSLGGLL